MQQTTMAPSANKVYVQTATVRPTQKAEQRTEVKSETKQEQSHTGNFPEKKFRAGPISVTVWHNKTQKQNGEEGDYQTVSIERSYMDKDGKWQTTNSLRTNDVPKAIVALQKAYEHIVLQEQDLTKGGN